MKNIFYLPENFEQYDFVVEKLRLDLKELIRGAVPSKEIVEYINDLKGQLTRLDRGDRSMLFLLLGSPEMSIPAPIEPPVRSLRAAIPATQSHYSGGRNHHSGN